MPDELTRCAGYTFSARSQPICSPGRRYRTVHELLGHRDVATTMIYTHVLRHGADEMRSPSTRCEPSNAERWHGRYEDYTAGKALCLLVNSS